MAGISPSQLPLTVPHPGIYSAAEEKHLQGKKHNLTRTGHVIEIASVLETVKMLVV